jgi:transcription-repair coupling factor (superfamily II helicase)
LTDHVESLLQAIRADARYRSVLQRLLAGRAPSALGLPRAARLPVLTALHGDAKRTVLVVTDRADHALLLFDELGFWMGERRYLFPEPSPLFYERAAWSPVTRRERIQTLSALAAYQDGGRGSALQPPIVIASVRAVMARTLPPADFIKSSRVLSRGMSVQPDHLRRSLSALGYERAHVVLEAGQFSVRGGIFDIWPTAAGLPIRLDFFGEAIESLRVFDPATQRTIEALDTTVVTPAREFLAPPSATGDQGDVDPPPFSEFDTPALHPGSSSLMEYLPANSVVLLDDLSQIESMVAEVEEQAVAFRAASITEGTLPPDFPIPYATWPDLLDHFQERGAVELGHSSQMVSPPREADDDLGSSFRHDERFGGRLKPFTEYLLHIAQGHERAIVVSRQSSRLQELWKENRDSINASDSLVAAGGESRPFVEFVEASLSDGFVLGNIHLITDAEIFGWERPQPRARHRAVPETPEAFYADLQGGDYVVHIDHGVGRYVGLMQRDLDGHPREYLAIEYEGGSQLFVPVHQADRLTRYVGAEGAEPALDRLGGQEWHEKKGRVKEAVVEVARDMLELHARRQVVRGHAFQADTSWQKELENSFPYVETEDQAHALADIKRDMEAPRPMDRLLCGDVGYGKTEVALRAAFKAVMDGKQVAMLVPTTVLAQQHYETFLQRLAAFPIKIEMLSRFRSPREQSDILVALALGEIDIVIGTHRLISADVQFKELGLVIIDEEQRFGVTHKEHLKRLRTEVDVLTLTATPIPRTLYMALTGVRDISNLNTPPEERLPIVTYVGPYSPQLARQAIVRELERGGQVFFVHNRVNTIDAMRIHLAQLVPEARVDVGHGQMPEHELADVMHRFGGGHTDILLSTTIIESGLDIPNANTLIVDRADTFGLAQLYQLRGRVGRGAVRAYAYFFRHRKISPTHEAQQRLEVIAENTELGAGYSIAMRDLEIRGAGELLGTHQHGQIQAVGFHLYTRLLSDAVRHLRRSALAASGQDGSGSEAASRLPRQLLPALIGPLSMPVNVDLPLAVGIPADYIVDQDLRLRLYRRIADIRDEAEIDAMGAEFHDRFGPPPEMVLNLIFQMRVKLRAERVGLASIGWESGQVVLRFSSTGNGKDEPRLPDLAPGVRGGKGSYWCSFGKDAEWQPKLLGVLDLLDHQ